jgi:hypothetical protein
MEARVRRGRGSMAVALRLHKKCSDEHGPDEPEGEKVNQGAF